MEANPFRTITGVGVSVFYASMGSNDYYRFCLKYKDNIKGARRARLIGKVNVVLFAGVWLFMVIAGGTI